MRFAVDLLYAIVAIVTAPVWIVRMCRTGKLRTDWAARLGRTEPVPGDGPRLLLHAVSVGEVNAIRLLVEHLAEVAPHGSVVVATATDTGFRRATELFGGRCAVRRYPFDFSGSVRRFLDAVRPTAVALVELEVWPNFVAACTARSIPVCVINGRLSERSTRRYAKVRSLVAPSFERLAFVAAQDATYAERFRTLGTRASDVLVTGTMKWDTAHIADEVPQAAELAAAMGIDRQRPLVVGGSTAPGEHELLHEAVPEDVQLLCAPRKPEWFDQAASALPGCARRSRGERGSPTGRFLLDTIGELRAAYALADVVVVGRTFADLGGSDMIEPVALGKATIVGPSTRNFADTVAALHAAEGIVEVAGGEVLAAVIGELLVDEPLRVDLAARGRAVIRERQGATARHAELLLSLLDERTPRSGSA
jgi:3-deoxy-D-manno-octulosonic-acid transferase